MKVVYEINRQQWSEFVNGHPDGCIFQTPEMYSVYEQTKNYEPLLVAALDDEASIVGILVAVIQRERSDIFGGLTARSVIWGGPVVKDTREDVCDFLLTEYEKIVKTRALYTQFRNVYEMRHFTHIFSAHGYASENHLNIHVNLQQSEKELWKQLHSKRRNEIRRAMKVGTYVQELRSREQINHAYDILKDVYHNARLPIADQTMFLAAHAILGARDMIRYFGAFSDGRLIGVICLLAYKRILYDWYAGSLRQYYNKYPNDLLPWETFKWGQTKGYTLFDFGGAGNPHKDYGVRDYKKKFGGITVNLGRFEKIHQPVKLAVARVGFKLWRTFHA